MERECDYRILGWFENGFRHISNRVRPVHMPADLKGMHIRVLPSQIQKRTFELLGARPQIMDLTDAIRMIKAGEIDAQENPLTNTVTYGVHKFHRFHTISNHFYISRPIFLHRPIVRWLARRPQGGDAAGGDRTPSRSSASSTSRRRRTPKRRSAPRAARSSRWTPRSTTPSPRPCSRSTPRRRRR